jgi:hypothetical protein
MVKISQSGFAVLFGLSDEEGLNCGSVSLCDRFTKTSENTYLFFLWSFGFCEESFESSADASLDSESSLRRRDMISSLKITYNERNEQLYCKNHVLWSVSR